VSPWNFLFLQSLVLLGLQEWDRAEFWMLEFLLENPSRFVGPDLL